MIFDHTINFYSEHNKRYNPHTSRHEGGAKLIATLYGNVTDVGTDRSVRVLGNLNSNSRTVRTYDAPPADWSYLTIDDGKTKFRLVTQRQLLKLFTMIVGEDNGQN